MARAVDIITGTFNMNPGVSRMLRKGGDHSRKTRRIAAYAFIKAFLRNGVFISSKELGVARGIFPALSYMRKRQYLKH
jgi:hypothetical protein